MLLKLLRSLFFLRGLCWCSADAAGSDAGYESALGESATGTEVG